jgi:putative phosphoesterase
VRIAALADIHGNLRALEAVQRDLRKQSPDVVVNLGDHLSGPLQAAATGDALMAENYVTLRGNHDRQLLDRPPGLMGPSDKAAYAQLNDAHKEWLRSLPAALELDTGVLLCHGTPADDLQYLLETVNEDGAFPACDADIRERLAGAATSLVLCGHSHIPRVVSLDGMHVVNPGSVGLPAYDDTRPFIHYMEAGSPHARYAIVDREPSGWRISMIAVQYDRMAASAEAKQAGRLDWAQALATGYALREKSS